MGASEGNSGDSHGHGPPPPPEPKTPLWLSAVGAVLFLTVGLVWALTPEKAHTASEAPPATSVATPDAGAARPGH